METTFSKGDMIILKAYGNKIGIIDGEPKEAKDNILLPVSIDPSQPSSYYPIESLEKCIPPQYVKQLLKPKEFSSVSDFIQALIYKKLKIPF